MLRYSCWQGYFLVSKGAKRYTSTLRNISNLHPKRTYCNSKMVVFDRNIKKIHRDRASLSKNYDYLREEVAKRLVERLDDILGHEYPVVLDLGAGCGTLTKHLQDPRLGVQTLFSMDMSEKLLFRDQNEDSNYRVKPIRIIGDEEFIPFQNQSLHMVISNLSLHWVNDLPGTFIQVRKCLNEDGLFLGAILGENTLQELRNSFTLAEQEREGGGVSDMGNLLTRAKFGLPTVDSEVITINYADPFMLMNDLREMGEVNAVLQRRPKVPRDTMMAAASIYKELYGNPDGSIKATFQIVYFIGWCPHQSQQQPLKRGTGKVSLKTLGEGGKL